MTFLLETPCDVCVPMEKGEPDLKVQFTIKPASLSSKNPHKIELHNAFK